MRIAESELILNKDQSIYHLKLKPGEVATTIITVGDPQRVDLITNHFDSISISRINREFKTVTGSYKGLRLTVIATGIGTDNIDIVFNELDALFNIDFQTRQIKEDKTALRFIRIGTSGTLREDIPVDSYLISKYAVGLDGLLHYYKDEHTREKPLEDLLKQQEFVDMAYAVSASEELLDLFSEIGLQGITLTAPGFYAPQSRQLRLEPKYQISQLVSELNYKGINFTNLEMETAGIYGLAALLGHQAISLNALLANRITGEFSNKPSETVESLIKTVLECLQKNQK